MAVTHQIEDYFAGVLEGGERAAFERHLEECPYCQRALEELRRLDGRLAAELPRAIAAREPRREWLETLGYDLPIQRRGRYHRLWLLLAPALAAALFLAGMWALNEWKGAAPALRRAVDATLAESFTGSFTVSQDGATLLEGTLRHQPGDRWVVDYVTPDGRVVEQVQIAGEAWLREGVDGAWTRVDAGAPLEVLLDGRVPVLDAPGLMEGLRKLDRASVEGPPYWPPKYSGVDRAYLGRALKGSPAISAPMSGEAREWLEAHPPKVEADTWRPGGKSSVLLAAAFTFELPDAAPVAIGFGIKPLSDGGPPIVPPAP